MNKDEDVAGDGENVNSENVKNEDVNIWEELNVAVKSDTTQNKPRTVVNEETLTKGASQEETAIGGAGGSATNAGGVPPLSLDGLIREKYQDAVKTVFAAGYTPKLFNAKTGEEYFSSPPPEGSVVVKATAGGAVSGKSNAVNLYCSDSKTINKKTTTSVTGQQKDWKRVATLAGGGLLALLTVVLLTVFVYSKIEEGKLVAAPNVSGMTVDRANELLSASNLSVGSIQEVNSLDEAEGVVLSQSPTAGSEVKKGSGVTLVVSAGPKVIKVPEIVGASREQAENTITASNLVVGEVSERDSGEPAGVVIEQSVAAGAEVREGTEVSFIISNGKTEVPSVIGKTLEQASTELAERGFKVKPSRITQEGPTGTVVGQDPPAGTFLAQDSEVEVTYTTPPVVVPSATPTSTPNGAP